MATAEILFDGISGNKAIYAKPPFAAVLISNNDTGGEFTWEYTLTHRPVGSSASLTITGPSTRTLTPDKEGTYIIKLVVNGTKIDVNAIGVLYYPSHLREPAVSETTEWDDDEGWAEALKNIFERVNFGVGALPVASNAVWGRIWHVPGDVAPAVPTADTFHVCLKDAADVYYWHDLTAGGGGDTYTNALPTPQALGGIEINTTFAGRTMTQMWDALLYPYQYPSFATFTFNGLTGGLKEIGDVIPVAAPPNNTTLAGSINNIGNMAPLSGFLRDVTTPAVLVGPVTFATPFSYTISMAQIQKLARASHVFRAEAQNTRVPAGTFTRDITFTWAWMRYYGNSADAALLGNVVWPPPAGTIPEVLTNQLVDAYTGSYYFAATAPGEYKYICYADVLGGSPTFKDALTLLNVAMELPYLVSITNAFGQSTNYRVYRTTFQISGELTILVS